MGLVPKSEFGPDDTKGNLAEIAQLESIQNLTEVAALGDIANLTELASLAKANDQFIVMGADGKIAIVPIKQFTDEIAKKYQLPENGTEQQLLSGAGGLIETAALPVSTAMQAALNAKASYNWIINGDFTINQRGGVKKPANGVYGFDRWKGHANGIEQIIEALPAGEYTLTWSGGGDGRFGGQTKASPIKATVAGGNTSVVAPETATKVSVVRGDATAQDPWPYVHRSLAEDISLSQRYYEKGYFQYSGFNSFGCAISQAFKVGKRTAPTMILSGVETQSATGANASNVTIDGFRGGAAWPGTAQFGYVLFNWTADAEL